MEQVLIILLKQVIKLNRKLPCALFTVKKERKTGKCAGDSKDSTAFPVDTEHLKQ